MKREREGRKGGGGGETQSRAIRAILVDGREGIAWSTIVCRVREIEWKTTRNRRLRTKKYLVMDEIVTHGIEWYRLEWNIYWRTCLSLVHTYRSHSILREMERDVYVERSVPLYPFSFSFYLICPLPLLISEWMFPLEWPLRPLQIEKLCPFRMNS